jgi:TolA-binding protein
MDDQPLPSRPDLSGWIKAHQEAVAVGAILLLLAAFGAPYYFYSRDKSEKDARTRLNLAQFYFHAQVDPERGFKTTQEKFQQALTAFQRVTTDYRGTNSSRIAQFYTGKCQFFLGQYIPAYSSFEIASGELKGTPLGEEAVFGKILCLEAQKQITQALTLGNAFLKENPDSFLAPEIQVTLASLHLRNKEKEKAEELLQKTVKEHSGTAWGREAARRLKGLSLKANL